ncbi:hypothetical protein HK103_003796, partial [Boothiomyces macroporosus]
MQKIYLKFLSLQKDDFITKIWDRYSSRLHKRAVLLPDETIVPCDEEVSITDIDKYMLIRKNKNNECISILDFATLRRLEAKDVPPQKEHLELIVLVYSTTLSKSAQFASYHEKYLAPSRRDRSGAAANVLVEELTERLRDSYGNRYNASGSTWRCWANYLIANFDQNEIDQAAEDLPPQHLIHLFRPTRNDYIREMDDIVERSRLTVDALDEIQAKADDLKTLLTETQRRYASLVDTIRIYRQTFVNLSNLPQTRLSHYDINNTSSVRANNLTVSEDVANSFESLVPDSPD